MARDNTETGATAPLPATRPGSFAVAVLDGEACTMYRLPQAGVVTIGRADDAGIRIQRPWVSRRHAVLRVDAELLFEDLGSSNSTRVRGVPLGPRQVVRLSPGDLVEIGSINLVIQHRPGAPAADERIAEGDHLQGEIADVEKRRILATLARCGGNQSRAAKELGISRNTLLARLRTYGVARPRNTP